MEATLSTLLAFVFDLLSSFLFPVIFIYIVWRVIRITKKVGNIRNIDGEPINTSQDVSEEFEELPEDEEANAIPDILEGLRGAQQKRAYIQVAAHNMFSKKESPAIPSVVAQDNTTSSAPWGQVLWGLLGLMLLAAAYAYFGA
ncbi:MAG: hypothetical protein A2542_01610 [Parcubacteria group bacterium RIFOXYD2_FULL_52_8]|nr:MAG: hypothetical protein A2542_01610 [Parcubacteria group bacterium RIFOXYD2_FULL_52_8]